MNLAQLYRPELVYKLACVVAMEPLGVMGDGLDIKDRKDGY